MGNIPKEKMLNNHFKRKLFILGNLDRFFFFQYQYLKFPKGSSSCKENALYLHFFSPFISVSKCSSTIWGQAETFQMQCTLSGPCSSPDVPPWLGPLAKTHKYTTGPHKRSFPFFIVHPRWQSSRLHIRNPQIIQRKATKIIFNQVRSCFSFEYCQDVVIIFLIINLLLCAL